MTGQVWAAGVAGSVNVGPTPNRKRNEVGWMHLRWPWQATEESLSESQLSEESCVTQEQACYGILAVYSHGLGPA